MGVLLNWMCVCPLKESFLRPLHAQKFAILNELGQLPIQGQLQEHAIQNCQGEKLHNPYITYVTKIQEYMTKKKIFYFLLFCKFLNAHSCIRSQYLLILHKRSRALSGESACSKRGVAGAGKCPHLYLGLALWFSGRGSGGAFVWKVCVVAVKVEDKRLLQLVRSTLYKFWPEQ